MDFNRRSFLSHSLKVFFATSAAGLAWESLGRGAGSQAAAAKGALRAVNIMNFIRASEPRGPMDLMLPVKEQMELIQKHRFPATWLLQYDALVSGPFVKYLRDNMPDTHETGLWFEMNRALTDEAGVAWRGKPEWEWDYHVPVAYTIGYTSAERRKLADAAMKGFKQTWGRTPKSVAAWNLDAWTMAHLSDEYGVEAFAVCRDQIATDGFTIWGAPIAGYYPSRINAWSPALAKANQIPTPVFRLLGQDPVYAYEQRYRLEPTAPDSGAVLNMIDTMEPVWPSGRSTTFIRNFLRTLAEAPCGEFAYAQLGQENSFGWPEMEKGYRIQMEELAKFQGDGALKVETMGATGRRFREVFPTTPMQAQIVLSDPFDRNDPAVRTVWYQSRFYRANLHLNGREIYFRDIVVYSDRYAQPFLKTPVTNHGIQQRMLSVLDGHHWSESDDKRAAGRIFLQHKDGSRSPATAAKVPTITEQSPCLTVDLPLEDGAMLSIKFDESGIFLAATGAPKDASLVLDFEWNPKSSALAEVSPGRLSYEYFDFKYAVEVSDGEATRTPNGAEISAKSGSMYLKLAQPS